MAGHSWLGSIGRRVERAGAERDLETARRLGYWYTEEDRRWALQHQAHLALQRRTEVLHHAVRVGTVAALVAAWAIPPLWPVALVASFRVFPRTSRRLLLALLALSGATVVASGVVIHRVLESALSPPPPALRAAPPTEPSTPP